MLTCLTDIPSFRVDRSVVGKKNGNRQTKKQTINEKINHNDDKYNDDITTLEN